MIDTVDTQKLVPWINDLLAAVVIVGVYLVRIGHVAENEPASLWLQLTTDLFLPVIAGVWIFGAALLVVWRRS